MKRTCPIALLLAALMLLSLCACAIRTEPVAKTPPDDEVPEESAREEESPAAEMEEPLPETQGGGEAAAPVVWLRVRETDYEADGTPGRCRLYEYDARGNQTLRESWRADGSLAYHCEYTYDSRNRMVEERERNELGSELSRTVYTYDRQGNLRSTEYWSHGTLQETRSCTYENGLLTAENYSGTDREQRLEYTYDRRGSLTAMTAYDGAGRETGRYEAEYDSDGNCIREYESWDAGGGEWEESIHLREYDRAGNLIRSVRGDGEDPERSVRVYAYDAAGNCIREDYWYRGELSEVLLYDWDDAGHRILLEVCAGDGELDWACTYEYDEHGNLLRRNDYDGAYQPDGCTEYEYIPLP